MSRVRKYLSILRVELEDLEEDLTVLKNLYSDRDKRREISHYACMENVALVQEEISGIADMVRSMEEIDPDQYSGLEELVADLEKLCRRRIKESDFPQAVLSLVQRKLEKVLRYVLEIES